MDESEREERKKESSREREAVDFFFILEGKQGTRTVLKLFEIFTATCLVSTLIIRLDSSMKLYFVKDTV